MGTSCRSDADEAATVSTAAVVQFVVLPLEAADHAVPWDAAASGAGAETGLNDMRTGLPDEGETTELTTIYAIVREAHDVIA